MLLGPLLARRPQWNVPICEPCDERGIASARCVSCGSSLLPLLLPLPHASAAKVESVGQPDVLLCPQCWTLSQHPTLAVVLHVSGLQGTPTGLHSHSRSAIRCCGFVLRTASLRRARVLLRGLTISARLAVRRLTARWARLKCVFVARHDTRAHISNVSGILTSRNEFIPVTATDHYF